MFITAVCAIFIKTQTSLRNVLGNLVSQTFHHAQPEYRIDCVGHPRIIFDMAKIIYSTLFRGDNSLALVFSSLVYALA